MKKIAVVIASVGLLAVAACGQNEEAATNNVAVENVVENASDAVEDASNAVENASNAVENSANAANAM